MEAARRNNLSPEALARIIGAEAPVLHGQWNPRGENRGAVGLAQAHEAMWEDEARHPGSYLNQHARRLGYVDEQNRIVPEHRAALMDLRADPELSINAAADYAGQNTQRMRRENLLRNADPETEAYDAYLAHHEGYAGARGYLDGTRQYDEDDFNGQFQGPTWRPYAPGPGGDWNHAYRNALDAYIRRSLNLPQPNPPAHREGYRVTSGGQRQAGRQ
jgi:hypothetical protein